MPVTVDSVEEAGVFSSVGVSIEGVSQGGEGRYIINVPPRASGLIVTITAGGVDGVEREPRNFKITMANPRGERVEFERQEGGQYIFLSSNPEDGGWVLAIAYGPDASVELNATTVQPDWIEYLHELSKRFGSWVGCKACKRLLKALIAAALIYFVVAHAPIVITTIPPLLGVILKSDERLNRFFELLRRGVKEPLDRLAEQVCAMLGFCPA